jgi:putative serine protease PepD
MTNHPRYSPPPQQPGYGAGPNQPAPPAYGQGPQAQQPGYTTQFDWRYQQPQYRPPYEPFTGTGPVRVPGGTGTGPIGGGSGPGPIPPGTGQGPIPGMLPPMPGPSGPPVPQKRSRTGVLAAGAVAIAVISAGIGG